MDTSIKAKWVEALRSGKYAQANRRLRDRDAYCCLGVLCDISGLGNWESDAVGNWVFSAPDHWSGLMFLPGSVKDHIAFPSGEDDVLMNMNDQGKSFAEIADYIEQKL